jgi:ubiquinone/menaquinone biosynthesis C-methylase UbiE
MGIKEKLYSALPHPARFYDDLQGRTGIKNYHKKVDLFLAGLKPGSVVLDLGCGNRNISLPEKTVIGLDVVEYEMVDVIGDAEHLPFKDEAFDAILLQQVLEHVEAPEQVLKESRRVLKEGGSIWVETPFIYHVHGDTDYRRWTKEGLALMCSKFFKEENVGVVMGAGSTLSLISRYALSALFSFGSSKLFYALMFVFGWLTFWMKYFDSFIKGHKYVEQVASGIYFRGRKEKEYKKEVGTDT